MTLQDSPSLSDFSEGYQPPPDPEKERRRLRIIIGVISLFVFVLAAINFMQSDLAVALARKGSVTGFAVNEAGKAIQVEVLVFGTDIIKVSDESGFFVIENIPAGEQSVIVAYGNIATEVEVMVKPGIETMLGTVTVPTDLLFFVDE